MGNRRGLSSASAIQHQPKHGSVFVLSAQFEPQIPNTAADGPGSVQQLWKWFLRNSMLLLGLWFALWGYSFTTMIPVFMSLLTLSEILEERLLLCARAAGVHWCELAQQSKAQQDYFFSKNCYLQLLQVYCNVRWYIPSTKSAHKPIVNVRGYRWP